MKQANPHRPVRLTPVLGILLAACSAGGGGGGAAPGGGQGTGRIAGRALVEGGTTTQGFAADAMRRTDDDDALRARDLGDVGPTALAQVRSGFDAHNRADWMRAVMTTTGAAHVRLTAEADVTVTVYRLRQGSAPHVPVHAATGTNIEADLAVEAGDHLLLAVQGEAGTYECRLTNDDRQAPLTALAAATFQAAGATLAAALPEVVPGDLIVRGADEGAVIAAQRLGFEVLARRDDVVRLRSVLGTALRADDAGRAALGDALFRVRRVLPQAAWVEPNLIRRAARQPNDPLFNRQWAAQITNLTQAWDTTIGEAGVIAVLDTGILANHPDLLGKVLPDGFDFVSDANNGDGDGIDADPADPLVSGNEFHGSHVAGIAAAATDNGEGIAGVNWNARILPLRVLGLQSGSDFDLAEAIRYAAGLRNVSGRLPNQPARVLNMSLGGPGDSAVLHDAVRAAAQAGVIMVVAAGNAAQAGNQVEFPAAYEEVIAVGAVGPTGDRAPYSQIQSYVDVAAPGGDMRRSGLDGILSTVAVERNGRFVFDFAFFQGTSMAAPFVSGAVSLMLSLKPTLTFQDVMTILAQTSRDRGAPGRDAEFGFGIIDVAAAVNAARNAGGVGDARILLDRTTIEFAPDRLSQTIQITSTVPGREIDDLTAALVGPDLPGLEGGFDRRTTPATFTLRVTPELAAQPRSFTIAISSARTAQNIEVQARIVAAGGGAATLVVELLDEAGQVVRKVDPTGGAFAFEALAPGNYRVRAGVDGNGNGNFADIGDFASDEIAVTVTAGGNADAGTLRASRNVAGGGDLTGEFGFSEFRNNASLTVIYTFRADGSLNQRRSFSTQIGTTESNTPGTFSVRGDKVTIQVENVTFTGQIERAGGQIQALLFGNDRFSRL